MISRALFDRFYPGDAHDGTIAFFGWLRGHCAPDMRVLDVGAGLERERDKRCLAGSVARVVGVDVDPVVLTNRLLDEAHVTNGVDLPFDSHSFDLAYSDWVLEHVEHPLPFLAEIRRVLKPGGAFLFRTPNLWHYVALTSACTPHWVHQRIVNPMLGLPREAGERYPTFYRLNSRRTIRRLASRAGFAACELRLFDGDPTYLRFNRFAFLLGVAYERAVNSHEALAAFRSNIFGKLRT